MVPREGPLVADLISFCQRKYPGNGVALYWIGSLDQAQTEALRAGPFREAALPHWIRASQTGESGPSSHAAGSDNTSRTSVKDARQ